MKKYILNFLIRGCNAAVGGPIVLAIVYLILGLTGAATEFSTVKMATEILTVAVMAFIAAGITVVYKIERLPVFMAALLHGAALYLDYALFYLLNGWLKNILIFSLFFIGGYLIVWLIIYLITRRKVKKLNESIEKENI